MIIKTDKAGNTLQSWATIEEAAKAIKLAPAVLKKHLKGKPPLLGGFVFKEKAEELTKEPKESEFTEALKNVALDNTTALRFKNYQTDKEGNREELKNSVIYVPTPESFDGPPLSNFTADEAGLFRQEWTTKEDFPLVGVTKPVMLDEFGDVIPPEIPEEAYGHTGIPPEIADDDLVYLDKRIKALEEPVDPEEVADYLRTPLQRRLHELNKR